MKPAYKEKYPHLEVSVIKKKKKKKNISIN